LQGEWLRDVSPSNELRKWAYASGNFYGFCARCAEEMAASPACEAVETRLDLTRAGPVTLLYAAKDEAHNNAVALRAHLLKLLVEDV